MSNLTFYTTLACAGISSALISFSYYKQKRDNKTLFDETRKLKRSKSSPQLNSVEYHEKGTAAKNVLWGWFSK